jgi:hypothetical protein
VLALGGYLFVRITTGSGLAQSGASGTQHPTLAVFLCPLLLVAGASGLAARAAQFALGRGSGRRIRELPVPIYLALRRLKAARGLLVALVALCAVSFGAFVYAESLAASLAETTEQKAYITHGSDVEAIVQESEQLPRDFPYPLTRVQYDNAAAALNSPTGPPVDLLVVDPATLTETLHWRSAWGADPTELLRELAEAEPWPLPLIVTSNTPRLRALSVQGTNIRARVLGTVRAFPGLTTNSSVVTSFEALERASRRAGIIGPLAVPRTSVWAKGPPRDVENALAASGMDTYFVASVDDFRRDPNVLLATRTYSYMRLIALASGALVLVALLLYLQARQRSQAIASALSRRMGFERKREIFSLWLELGAIVVFCSVVGAAVALAAAGPITRKIDPLPDYAPSPLFAVPWPTIALAAGVLAVIALVAGAVTSWFARRANVSEALRVA